MTVATNLLEIFQKLYIISKLGQFYK